MSPSETRPEAQSPSSSSAEILAKPRRKSLVREYAEAIVVAVVLALVIRAFVVQAFTIPSGSMMDTLLVGDYILVNKFLYGAEVPYTDVRLPGIRDPRRGDIIVFKYPNDESRDFIKRIVAVGGETVQVKDNRVYVDGQRLEEPYVRPASLPAVASDHCRYEYACTPTAVPSGAYFVMGDNRDNSQDSRYWGFVKREKIRGKAFMIYWSWDSDQNWLRWRRLGDWLF
jgi:signal peptidase I